MVRTRRNQPAKPAETEPEVDPFAYLFNDFDNDQEVVTLARLEPDTWQGVNIKGFICKLSPGHDESWIKENYGGGKYILNRKSLSTGKITGVRTIEIAGNPLVASAPYQRETSAISNADPVEIGSMPSIDVGGVSVPVGDLETIKQVLLYTRLVDQMFPKKPDINDTLLQLAMKRNDTSAISIVRELKEAAELLNTGGESTGANMNDIIMKITDTAGTVLSAVYGNKGRPGQAPLRSLPGPVQDVGQVTNQVETQKQPSQSGEPAQSPEGDSMSQQALLGPMVAQLCNSFRLQPPKEPKAVVRMLDQVLRQSDVGVRRQLVAQFKDTVFDFCEVELSNDWSGEDVEIGSREDFKQWIDLVFELYQDDKRELAIL